MNELKLVRLLVKVAVAASVVLELAIVGFAVVLQQTPLAIMVLPPSLLTVPPLVAVVAVMLVAAVVALRVGSTALVVKLIAVPYPVPILLVA